MKLLALAAWKLASVFAVALLVVALGTIPAFAESSGSFNFNSDATTCTDINGALDPVTENGVLNTTMKLSSGSGNALVIRPSAVTGLLTNTTISGTGGGGKQISSAQAFIQFKVTVKPLSGQADPSVTPDGPVTYDDRFLQISTNLFDKLSVCTAAAPCTFSVNETTLSAHSFDFVVTGLSAGNYEIKVDWTATSPATSTTSTVQACVGPVVITAEQVKIFQQNTGILF